MNIKVVVFNHNQRATAEALFASLAAEFDTALFDSGSAREEVSPHATHCFENLFWTGCWNKAWELFPDFDAIWGIGGDCVLKDDPPAYRRSIQNASPFGIWSPAIQGYSENYMKVQERATLSVKFLEGIAFAVSRSLWQSAGPFDRGNYIGWGHDVILSHLSRQSNMPNILDANVKLFHPPSEKYNKDAARILMAAAMRKRFGDGWQKVIRDLDRSLSVHENTLSIISSSADLAVT